MDEEIEKRFQALEETCAVLLGRTEEDRVRAHKGISVVASEGLRGGGTIEISRPLALNFGGLDKKKLKHPLKEFVPFWVPEEGQHFITEFSDLVNAVVRHSGLVESILDLGKQIQALREKVDLFTIYERLYKAEELVGNLKERLDAQEAERETET